MTGIFTSQPGRSRCFPVINLKRAACPHYIPTDSIIAFSSELLQFYVYLFEEHLDKETDVFSGVREWFVCVFQHLNGISIKRVFSVRLHERTKSSTLMECLCIMIIILVLMHHWQSSSEYLAAFMRRIFIFMFYFPLNGSSEQPKLVRGGLNRFKPADKCPNPSQTSAFSSSWRRFMFSWGTCAVMIMIFTNQRASGCVSEIHWHVHGTDYPQSLCPADVTGLMLSWRVLSGRFFSTKCTERVCCTITFLLGFLYFLYIKNNKLFFKHHVICMFGSVFRNLHVESVGEINTFIHQTHSIYQKWHL